MAKGGRVYIMTSKPRGVLYTGVTAELAARVDAHRNDRGSAFPRRYDLKILAYAEAHDGIDYAITREKAIEAWKREGKIELIETINPDWEELFGGLA